MVVILTQDEANRLARLVDAAVRAEGLKAVDDAAAVMKKVREALQRCESDHAVQPK